MVEYEPLRYRVRADTINHFADFNLISLRVEEAIDEYLTRSCIYHKVYPIAQLGAGGIGEIGLIIRILNFINGKLHKLYRNMGFESLYAAKPILTVDFACSATGYFRDEDFQENPGDVLAELLATAECVYTYLSDKFPLYTIYVSVKLEYEKYNYYIAAHIKKKKIKSDEFGRIIRFVRTAKIKANMIEVFYVSRSPFIHVLNMRKSKKGSSIRSKSWYFKFDRLLNGRVYKRGIKLTTDNMGKWLVPAQETGERIWIGNNTEDALRPGKYNLAARQEALNSSRRQIEKYMSKSSSSIGMINTRKR